MDAADDNNQVAPYQQCDVPVQNRTGREPERRVGGKSLDSCRDPIGPGHMTGQFDRLIEADVQSEQRGKPDPVPGMQPERDGKEVPWHRVQKFPTGEECSNHRGEVLDCDIDSRIQQQPEIQG